MAVQFSHTVNFRSRQNESGKDVLVNICGKVTCVSEVVKLKDSLLFMVKFIPNVDIIIKVMLIKFLFVTYNSFTFISEEESIIL